MKNFLKDNPACIILVVFVCGAIVYALAMISLDKRLKTASKIAVEKETEMVIKKEAETVKSLKELMPRFEVVTNSEHSYQIRFMSYEKTNWYYIDNIFSNSFDAQWTIALTQIELEVKYKIMKSIADDLKNIKP